MTDAEGLHLAPPESIGELRRQRLRWARLYFVCEARPHGNDLEPCSTPRWWPARGSSSFATASAEERDRAPGRTFRRLANTYVALFIVNDDPYLALELSADGVHLGQDDMDPAEARRIMGPDAIIGLSTHSREQIAAAAGSPVDYISVGPI